MDLTQRRLIELFTYHPGGFFTRNEPRGGQPVGAIVGGRLDNRGYRKLKFKGMDLKYSRQIWIYHNGSIPDHHVIDHINRDKADDRIENLRLVTPSKNTLNARYAHRGKLGVRGVNKTPQGRYRARIEVDRKKIHLGVFDTVEEASVAYKEASIKYFGEYHD